MFLLIRCNLHSVANDCSRYIMSTFLLLGSLIEFPYLLVKYQSLDNVYQIWVAFSQVWVFFSKFHRFQNVVKNDRRSRTMVNPDKGSMFRGHRLTAYATKDIDQLEWDLAEVKNELEALQTPFMKSLTPEERAAARSACVWAQNEKSRPSIEKALGKPDSNAEIPTAEELQKLLLEDGIKPEENLGSRTIIEEREKRRG